MKPGLEYLAYSSRYTWPKWGPVEKFAPPHAQIWGLTPNFKILFYGDPHPYKSRKFCEKSLPIFEIFFSQKLEQNFNFGGLGGLPIRKSLKKIQVLTPLLVVQIWSRWVVEHIPFFAFNRFPHCPQWNGRLITCILSAGKSLTTESVDVGDYIPQQRQMPHSRSRKTIDISRQKEPGGPDEPNGILVNWKRPHLVQKADLSLARSVRPSCQ